MVVKPDLAPSWYVQKLTRTMKTSGASRKKPSQRPPGSANAAVIQPPPRLAGFLRVPERPLRCGACLELLGLLEPGDVELRGGIRH